MVYLKVKPSVLLGGRRTLPVLFLLIALVIPGAQVKAAAKGERYQTDVPTVTSNDEWTSQTSDVDGVTMAVVPPGCFTMGSDNAPSEQPKTKICLDNPFYIDVYETTNDQFDSKGGTARRPSYWSDPQFPRNFISWFEARDYCESRNARLPTEAEWEYAARGPSDLAYPWGNDFDPEGLVYILNSGGKAAQVGSRSRGISWVGAEDMSGNVWEWTSSIYKPYPYKASDGRENLKNKASPRVRRGGSFINYYWVTTSLRGWATPDSVGIEVGFRCAKNYQ